MEDILETGLSWFREFWGRRWQNADACLRLEKMGASDGRWTFYT